MCPKTIHKSATVWDVKSLNTIIISSKPILFWFLFFFFFVVIDFLEWKKWIETIVILNGVKEKYMYMSGVTWYFTPSILRGCVCVWEDSPCGFPDWKGRMAIDAADSPSSPSQSLAHSIGYIFYRQLPQFFRFNSNKCPRLIFCAVNLVISTSPSIVSITKW